MVAKVGSLIVSGEGHFGRFSAAFGKAASDTARYSAQMRRSLGQTNAAFVHFERGGFRSLSGRAALVASRNLSEMTKRAELLRSTMLMLTAVTGGFTAAIMTNAVMEYADAFTSIHNQLSTVIDDSRTLTVVQKELFDIAQRSRTGWRETTVLFTRLARSTQHLGLSYNKLLDLTETIQKAFQVGGATPQEAASFAIQFSQALASNRLQGEELRAVLETPLGLELAKGIGVTIGKFRQLAKEGKLTADVLVRAIQARAAEIERLFANMPPTIRQALVNLDNAFLKFIGSQDRSLGAARMFVAGIQSLAQNINTVASAIVLLSTALGTQFLVRSLLGSVMATRAARLAHLEQARAAVAAAKAERVLAADILASSLAQKRAAVDAGLTGAARAKAFMAAAAAQRTFMASGTALVASQAALSTALAATKTRAVAMGTVMRSLAGIMAFLGGPIGLVITGLSVAIVYLATRTNDAEEAQTKYTEALEKARLIELEMVDAADKRLVQLNAERSKSLLAAAAVLEHVRAIEVLRMREAARADEEARMLSEVTGDPLTVDPSRIDQPGENVRRLSQAIEALKRDAARTGEEVKNGLGGAFGDLGNQADEAAEKVKRIKDRIAELKLEVAAGPLTEFERSVISQAQSMGIAEDAIRQYIGAMQGLNIGVGGPIVEVEKLMDQVEAWKLYRDILAKIGPTANQTAEMQRRLNFLVDQGRITAQQAAQAFEEWKRSFGEDNQAIADFASLLNDSLKSAVLEFKSLDQVAADFLDRLANIVWEEFVGKPLENAVKTALQNAFAGAGQGNTGGGIFGFLAGIFGGALAGGGGGGGAGVFHRGGVVGDTVPMRKVSPLAFAGAPRLHGGLASREFPAILEAGERVLSANDNSRMMAVLGGIADGGASAAPYAPVYNIDARGAAPGTAAQIKALLDQRDRQIYAAMPRRMKRAQQRGQF
jgi:tape measure domain-containing protein